MYKVTNFPDNTGTCGNPYTTRWWLLAMLEVWRRRTWAVEVRLRNTATGYERVW
jgi:hypothetical protein